MQRLLLRSSLIVRSSLSRVPTVHRRFLCSASGVPAPPSYSANFPSNVKIFDERVLDSTEDDKRHFVYVVPEGRLTAPCLRFDENFLLQDTDEAVELNRNVFGFPVRPDIIQRVIRWQLAKRRKGTARVKGIALRSGTGKKPFDQKGRGKARQGTLRAPHMRKGGRVHGPDGRRVFAIKLPKKVRRYALRSILTARMIENQLFIVESLSTKGEDDFRFKTKNMAALVQHRKWDSVYFIDENNMDDLLHNAGKNIFKVLVHPTRALNAYDMMKRKTIVISKPGLVELNAHLDESARPKVYY